MAHQTNAAPTRSRARAMGTGLWADIYHPGIVDKCSRESSRRRARRW
jgi:hypothetical protein